MTPGPALDPEIIWFLTCRFQDRYKLNRLNVSFEESEHIQLGVVVDSWV